MIKKNEIWSQITKSIESKLRKSEFKIWFSRAELQSCDESAAIIGVPNKFVASWIKENYADELKSAFKKFFNNESDILISFHPQNAHQGTTDAPEPNITDPFYRNHHLNSDLNFDLFVEGTCNRFALSSALQAAKGHSTQYNPLVIYSERGLGKTHLLNAIGNYALDKNPLLRCKFVTADSFTSDISLSIKNNSLQEVKNKYCDLDMLILDDVHRFETRKKIQEEFLSIFDALYKKKSQIVISSNKNPNEIPRIQSQLKSRLGGGLLSEIHTPDLETRIKVTKQKAEKNKITLPEDVAFFLANSHQDIKSLIKNIIRIGTYASLHSRGLNISLAKSIIRARDKTGIGISYIQTITASYFNISVEDLLSDKKKRSYSYPRQVAMFFARNHTDFSLKEIGDAFGPKDHSTVVYAVQRVEKLKNKDKEVQKDIKNIEKLLL